MLDCPVGEGGEPEVRWQRDGFGLDTEDPRYLTRREQSGLHRLVISGVRLGDAGQYDCTTGNTGRKQLRAAGIILIVKLDESEREKWNRTMLFCCRRDGVGVPTDTAGLPAGLPPGHPAGPRAGAAVRPGGAAPVQRGGQTRPGDILA